MTTQRFTCYWLGYMKDNNFSLDDIPDYIDYVNLFLINIDKTKYVNHTYITSQSFTWEEIQEGVKVLQSRRIKVIASLMSEPQFNFNQISDPCDFAKNVVDIVINQWELDGINIDPEMGGETPDSGFIQFVGDLRSAMGDYKLLTYVSYQYDSDCSILKTNISDIDWVSLMGYFWPIGMYQSQWNTYSAVVPPEKLLIGVSPTITSLDDTKTLAEWQLLKNGGGMMEFQINSDTNLDYASTINKAIHSNII